MQCLALSEVMIGCKVFSWIQGCWGAGNQQGWIRSKTIKNNEFVKFKLSEKIVPKFKLVKFSCSRQAANKLKLPAIGNFTKYVVQFFEDNADFH